jgi:hypothetical protein
LSSLLVTHAFPDEQENYNLHRALTIEAPTSEASVSGRPEVDNSTFASLMEGAGQMDDDDSEGEDTEMATTDKTVRPLAYDCPLNRNLMCRCLLCFPWHCLAQGVASCVLQQAARGGYSVAFKELVTGILQRNGFEDQRSSKLALDDFLRLLALFNEHGVHFTA